MRIERVLFLCFTLLLVLTTSAQKQNRQQKFPKVVPAGNYSGITPLGDDRYAVVCDKSAEDGFHVFRIIINERSGRIKSMAYEGFRSSGQPNRDQEGIAYVPQTGTLFISGETDMEILECRLDGKRTWRRLNIPQVFKTATKNYGFEALTYDEQEQLFWTTSESTLPPDGTQASPQNHIANRLRLQSFGLDMEPKNMYFYETDTPTGKKPCAIYALGVCGMCALGDGRLLVLEREAYVKKRKVGSYIHNKIYIVEPEVLQPGRDVLVKSLLCEFRTRFNLLRRNYANYEGICLGPRLADGRRVLLLVSDSQNQYKGLMRDWFKTIVLDEKK